MPQSGEFVPIWQCRHCQHKWRPRKVVPPSICPKCHRVRP